MRKSNRRRGTIHAARVNPVFNEKVKEMGHTHLGLLTIDAHKEVSEALFCDAFGNQLLEQATVKNDQGGIGGFIHQVERCCEAHGLKDVLVGIERSGRYHGPMKREIKKQTSWHVQIIQAFATKQLRQPVDSGNKTDSTDLDAMMRALIIGYGSEEPELPEPWEEWRALNRCREDNVLRLTTLKNQIHSRFDAVFPGFTGLVENIWNAPAYLAIAEHYEGPAAVAEASLEELKEVVSATGHYLQSRTLNKVRIWSKSAPSPESGVHQKHRLFRDDLKQLRIIQEQIHEYGKEMVRYLVETPFVLLMGLKGINVVSAAAYAAEVGPMEYYLNPKKISGRAGLYPSRYQSSQTDHANGPLVGCRNARLRDAILEIAANLLKLNPYFQAWREIHKDEPWKRNLLSVGNRFCRISYAIVSSGSLLFHGATESPDAILRKLYHFATAHELSPEETERLLTAAQKQLSTNLVALEVEALKECLPKRRTKKGKIEKLGAILERVMADLMERLPEESQMK